MCVWFVIFQKICYVLALSLLPADHFDHSGMRVGMDQDKHLWAICEPAELWAHWACQGWAQQWLPPP